MLTQARLKELLSYDPETGIFTRKLTAGGQIPGSVAGTLRKRDGYTDIMIDNHKYLSHRLAWLYMTGEFPEEDIDHIDGTRNNHSFSNLRSVSRTTNVENQRRAQRNNACGFLGVSKRGNKFLAQIWSRKTYYSLGLFDTPEEAHEAYVSAKRSLHSGCMI